MGHLFKGKFLWVTFIVLVSAFVVTAACTGPAGPAGASGAGGSAGTQGSQGPAGEAGKAGTDGLQGLAGTSGRTGIPGLDGAEGDKGDPGPSGRDAFNPQAGVSVSPTTYTVGGDVAMEVWVSGFAARDTVTAVIFSANGPGRNIALATGDVSLGGAGSLSVTAPIPADLTPGYYTVQVTGTRTPGNAVGPAVASTPILVQAAG